jgi:hypothetical protein
MVYDFYTIYKQEYKTFFGDEVNLYVPHFFHMHESIRNVAFFMGDFLTANHSTEFMLRPNVPSFNLMYVASALLPIDSVQGMYYMITSIIFMFIFLSVFYTQLVGLIFFKLNKYYSMSFAILFTFSSQAMLAKGFEPFIFVHMSFPILLFYALLLKRVLNFKSVYLISFVFIFVYLLGYLPLSIFSVLVSILFALLYNTYINTSSKVHYKSIKVLIQENKNLIQAFAIGSIVILPFYLAILFFNKAASTVPTGLEDVMNTFHLVPYDLFSMLSYGVFQFSKIETHTLYVGLIPVSILITYAFYAMNSMTSFDKRTINISLLIFIFTLFLSFGNYFSLSDLFYFYVPGLGHMHLPSRYMIISHFFLALAIVVILKNILQNRSLYFNYFKILGLLSVVLLLIINIFANFGELDKYMNIELFGMELLVFILFILFLLKYDKTQIIVLMGILIFLQNLTYKNFIAKNNNLEKNIVFNIDEMNSLITFFKENSTEKKIIKYLNLSSDITTYVPRNFPWYVENRIKLSNFYGYEPHLASYLEYRGKFPFYGIIDFNYVFNTGCDYIIVAEKDLDKYRDILKNRIEVNQSFHLSNGETVYKLKQIKSNYIGGVSGIIRNGSFDFGDNGWVLDKSWRSKNGRLYNDGTWGGAYANSATQTLNKGAKYTVMFKTATDSETGSLTVFLGDKLTKTIDVSANKEYKIDFVADGKLFLFASLDKLAIEDVWLFPFDEYQQKVHSDNMKLEKYDDGFILFNDVARAEVKGFETDYFGDLKYHIVVKKPISIDYKFFPSKTLTIKIENMKNKTTTDVYSTHVELIEGEYIITIKYKNFLVSMFLIFISLYIASIVFIVIRSRFKKENIKVKK